MTKISDLKPRALNAREEVLAGVARGSYIGIVAKFLAEKATGGVQSVDISLTPIGDPSRD